MKSIVLVRILFFFEIINFKSYSGQIYAMISSENRNPENGIQEKRIEIDEENPEKGQICTICYENSLEFIQFCHKEHRVCADCAKRYLQYLYNKKRALTCHVCRKELDKKWLKKLNIVKSYGFKKNKYLIQALCVSGTYAFLISLLMLRYLLEK